MEAGAEVSVSMWAWVEVEVEVEVWVWVDGYTHELRVGIDGLASETRAAKQVRRYRPAGRVAPVQREARAVRRVAKGHCGAFKGGGTRAVEPDVAVARRDPDGVALK